MSKDKTLSAAKSASNAVASYAYGYDYLHRPVSRNGDTFAYNSRGEVTNAVVAGVVEAHAYDDAGNLAVSTRDGVSSRWTANDLNQYAAIATGGATEYPGYTANGEVSYLGECVFAYDAKSRLVSAGVWVFDKERYLSGDYDDYYDLWSIVGVSNRYDHLDRRVQKITPAATHTYFYDGWMLIKEVIANINGTTDVVEYHWGKDLSGTIGGAGGVGGLLYLAISNSSTPNSSTRQLYVPWYDAYGNIMGYWDAQGNVVAQYTYDAFGKLISSSGPMADVFAIRYSTKYFDVETGFYYYGYRFYSPELMRWITRDPIGEEGGVNLYAMCDNAALYSIDAFGLSKYWDNYLRYGIYDSFKAWKTVGGNLYWLHLTDERYENSCALRVSRALVNSGESIPAALGRWVAKDYTVTEDTISRQGIAIKKGTVLKAEKPGSRYELGAEKMKGCLDSIITGDKLKEKKRLVQNSKAVKYAESIENCNDEAFFIGYSTEGWWHTGMIKKDYKDPYLFTRNLMYVTFWRLKK